MNRILLSIDIPRLKKIPLNQINYNIQGLSTKNLYNLWDELELHINDFFDKKNLGDLLKNNLETRI